jgi:hypothetical protein
MDLQDIAKFITQNYTTKTKLAWNIPAIDETIVA